MNAIADSAFLNRAWFHINDVAVTPLSVSSFVLIIALAYVISWLLRRALKRIEHNREPSVRPAFYAVSRILHYVLMIGGLMFALGAIGLDLSRVTLFVSALGVGLGFGMQAIISNFVSGLIILFERHLKIGDFVELESGVTGEVREINIRATRITTNDNIDVLVPNSEFVNGRVVNWTLEELSRRVRIKFGVSYSADKSAVREAVLKAANSVPFTRKDDAHKPQVWLTGFGDSALEFELVVWLGPQAVKRPATVQAAYCWAIDDALRDARIEIPFPQRDLHVRSLFGLEGEAAQRLFREEADKKGEPRDQAMQEQHKRSSNDALEEALRLSNVNAKSEAAPPSEKSD